MHVCYSLGVMLFGAVLFVIRVNLKVGGLIRSQAQGPLQGVVVLDLSVMIAGPMTASMLAELGAEVIKVDHVTYEDAARGLGNAPSRGMAGMFMQVGRGKQAICIDSRTTQGLQTIHRLVRKADVVIQVSDQMYPRSPQFCLCRISNQELLNLLGLGMSNVKC